jgi:hypothetical protein
MVDFIGYFNLNSFVILKAKAGARNIIVTFNVDLKEKFCEKGHGKRDFFKLNDFIDS